MSAKDPLLGTKMGDYTIQSLLGRGGMARVYRGYDENLERFAAVKVIDAQLLAGDDSDEYYTRFQREARSIARLQHSNIVGIYQFGQAGSDYYMAMVFVDGKDLRQILKEHNRNGTFMPKERVLKVMRAMTDALDYAHEHGVIHRDVKPSNILVTDDDTAVLTDFGLALNVPEGTIGNTFGSAHYIAPEQAVSSAQAVPQSDLYSLAICLYEMLTGRVPFDDKSAMSVALKHLSDLPPRPSEVNGEISPAVEDVLMKALEKEPQDRYETGAELMAALDEAFAGKPVDTAATQTATAAVVDAAETEASTDEETEAAVNAIQDSWRTATNASRSSKLSSDEVKKRTTERLAAVDTSQDADRDRPAWWLWAGVGVLAVAALLLIAVLNQGGGDPPSGTQTAVAAAMEPSDAAAGQETVAVAEDDASETPTDPPTETNTNTPTPTATDAPTENTTDEPTDEPTATNAPTEADTNTPAPTATDAPTEDTSETPAAVAAAATADPTEAGPSVQLRYNDRTVVLYNSSGETVSVSGLTFVRTRTSGAEVSFSSNEWRSGSTAPLSALPQEDCFQVWTLRYTLLPVESYCDSRHGWRSVATVNAFWRGDNGFEVRRGGEVIAECRPAPSVCIVPLGG